jgi:hypothetical protein
MDFSALKKNSGSSSLGQLTAELAKLNTNQETGRDERFWYPDVDKAGNGFASIRFLPAPGDEEVPFVRVWEHGFKGPTGLWYIENSLTTINKPDPCGELNSKLWNMSDDDNSPTRKQARDQKRKLNFITNIYIIQDQANPQNNGTVRLYKFGKKIYDKLNEAMNPQFADEDPMNPFDLWTGATFKLKIRNVEGYRNYDKSEFANPSPLFDDDEQMEAIWKQEHSLQAFLAPSNFKSYDELKAKLNRVLGLNDNGKPTPQASRMAAAQRTSSDDEDEDAPWNNSKPTRQMASSNDDDEDDTDLKFFQKLSR